MNSINQENDEKPVYVVLGATGGVGSQLCQRLKNRGANLVIAGRNEEKTWDLANKLEAKACLLDLTNPSSINSAINLALENYGKLTGIANCIGSILLKPAHLTNDSEWTSILETNLTSAFFTVRAAAKAMSNTGGSIVLVSSAAAQIGLANHEAIAAAKAGIIGLALSAAASYAPRGIRVNCVAPGLVRTPLTARITSNETALKGSLSMHPLGRVGEANDIASAIDWLLNSEQSWVTGQVIAVDGGLSKIKTRN
jgi:NAD(P)-dependent dehydrogenase (short-subunit alcohol dehydrogenase family)